MEPTAFSGGRKARLRLVAVTSLVIALGATSVLVLISRRPAGPVSHVATDASSEPITATSADANLRMTATLVVDESRPLPALTLRVVLEAAGDEVVRLTGGFDPSDSCKEFPARITVARTAWEPAGSVWPGASTYLGLSISGFMHNDSDARTAWRGFVDMQEPKYGVCDAALYVWNVELQPGRREERTFGWTPDPGWPGGAHEIKVSVGTKIGESPPGAPVEVTLPIDVPTPTSDHLGPAAALRYLGSDAAFRAEVSAHGGISALGKEWTAEGWTFRPRYHDARASTWSVDASGNVSAVEPPG